MNDQATTRATVPAAILLEQAQENASLRAALDRAVGEIARLHRDAALQRQRFEEMVALLLDMLDVMEGHDIPRGDTR